MDRAGVLPKKLLDRTYGISFSDFVSRAFWSRVCLLISVRAELVGKSSSFVKERAAATAATATAT